MAEVENELNEVLRRLGLRNWSVVWNPDGSEEERGSTYPDTRVIVIYDKDREDALETLIHEFLEVRMKGVIRPYMSTVNALLRALEKIYYAEKEETIDGLTPLLLSVLKEDFKKKDGETKKAVNYSKIFTVTDPIAHEPFTIFVEAFTPMGRETLFWIKVLEGEYGTQEEFEDARECVVQGWERGYTRDKGDGKLYSSITLMRPGARQLADSLNEALSGALQATQKP